MFRKPIAQIILSYCLLAMAGCSPAKPSQPDIPVIQKILDDYSASIVSGEIEHPESYSAEMQKLVSDRHAFFGRFFQIALHSDMTHLSSSFEQITIEQYDPESGLLYVNAFELVAGDGIYLSTQACLPQAVYWASLRAGNEVVKMELLDYFGILTADTKTFNGNATGDVSLGVSTHRLIMQLQNGVLQIIEDSFTDVNPQDNPQGIDVVEWQAGHFQRKQIDLTNYPDFQLYRECIEKNGTILLDEYKTLYGDN
jgi:hypothetical protein